MDKLLKHILQELMNNTVLYIEDIAESFLLKQTDLTIDTFDYFPTLNRTEKEIRNLIKKVNYRFTKDNLSKPIFVSSTGDFVKQNNTFSLLLESTNLSVLKEPNVFAHNIGTSLLSMIGCAKEDIHITPDTNDKGIDYWGELKLNNLYSSPNHSVLVVGQVKKITNNVPVKDLREFLGAIQIALSTSYFGESYNIHSPRILQFVTTGELSNDGRIIAEACKIKVITKRHISVMGIPV